jgi:hypothetical protein
VDAGTKVRVILFVSLCVVAVAGTALWATHNGRSGQAVAAAFVAAGLIMALRFRVR